MNETANRPPGETEVPAVLAAGTVSEADRPGGHGTTAGTTAGTVATDAAGETGGPGTPAGSARDAGGGGRGG
ncbi:hypothetical protein AB0395_38020, partial [Streptosporangium sp. NPDC051023]